MSKELLETEPRVRVTTYVCDATLRYLDVLAQRRGTTRSALLREVVEEWVEDQEAAEWVARYGEAALQEETVPWSLDLVMNADDADIGQ